MPPAKTATREYRALVNLSIGRVERGPNGREERAERVERGDTAFLTEAEAKNLGRYVRLVETETTTAVPTRVSPRQILGIGEVDKRGLVTDAAGALDLKNETQVIRSGSESEDDEEAQPYNNPTEPSYKADKDK